MLRRGLTILVGDRRLLTAGLTAAGAALLSIASSPAASEPRCDNDRFRFDFGASATTRVRVIRDTVCERSIAIHGAYVISGFTIDQRASHGIAGVSAARDGVTLRWAYKPNAGFTGEDEFVVKVTLVGRGNDVRDSTVTYHVTVR
jgi:hypothetical protein